MIRWQTRVLSALVVFVLAGTPALAAACDASCFGLADAEARTGTPHRSDHHAAAVVDGGTLHQASAGDHERHHPAAAGATNEGAPHDPVRLRSSSGPQCCSSIGQSVTPLHVRRGGSVTSGAPPYVEHALLVPVTRPDRQSERISSSLPDVPHAHAPLVLRV